MWDLLTLYDAKKKNMEDEAARYRLKEQKNELKQYYDSQVEFKNN